MLAYKFLLAGAVGPFSGFAWPTPEDGAPGPWVAAGASLAPCRAGVHGCLAAHLPWWLQAELWSAEFDEPVTSAGRKVVSPRARLVRRVGAWNAEASREFAEACARRARDHADAARDLQTPEAARISTLMAADAAARALTGPTATAAYIAAHAARHVGGGEAMQAERRWQADWLVRRLGLSEART